MEVLAKIVFWLSEYIVEVTLGLIISFNEEYKPRNRRLQNKIMFNKIALINRALVFLVLLITALVLIATTGCQTATKALLVRNTDGTYSEKPVVQQIESGVQQVGQAAAPFTGGLSIIVSSLAGAIFAAFVTALKKNAQITAYKDGLDTVNVALLGANDKTDIINKINERAAIDSTSRVINDHIG